MKKFHPALIIFTILLLVFGLGKIVVAYLFALVVHEFAHAIVAYKLGYKLKNFFLLPYGACLSYQDIFFDDDEIKIASAGPVASFLTGMITIAIWWIFPLSYALTYEFAIANFALCVFNLLPAFPLDGARVFICLISNHMQKKKAFKITLIFNYVLSALFLVVFIISCFYAVNFNFLYICLFLIIGSFDGILQGKYFPIYKLDKQKNLQKV
ncbi:MAG: site-2 protease family protein [Christensenellales bacterium]|jgi:stage IV sporulation protein FB